MPAQPVRDALRRSGLHSANSVGPDPEIPARQRADPDNVLAALASPAVNARGMVRHNTISARQAGGCREQQA